MTNPDCFYETDANGVATIFLNRPKVRNALNEPSVDLLIGYLHEIETNTAIRAVLLTSTGKDFCAGADLNWMQESPTAATTGKKPIGDKLAELLYLLHSLNKPTIALIQGAVYGGGAGLIASCDIALASKDAHFCFSEVRLGLIPSVISPYVLRAIGERNARRFFLSAEQLDAAAACRIGLVHEVLDADMLQVAADKLLQALIAGGPCALARTKELLDAISTPPLNSVMMLKTANWIGEVCQTEEARAGMDAFLNKRRAPWLKNLSSQL
jgi:methylglutaconyl-CoA hydratase